MQNGFIYYFQDNSFISEIMSHWIFFPTGMAAPVNGKHQNSEVVIILITSISRNNVCDNHFWAQLLHLCAKARFQHRKCSYFHLLEWFSSPTSKSNDLHSAQRTNSVLPYWFPLCCRLICAQLQLNMSLLLCNISTTESRSNIILFTT